MRFEADESSIHRLLMGYLREKGLFETLSSLQLEAGGSEEDRGGDMLYLQRLILQGRLGGDEHQYLCLSSRKSFSK